MNGPLAAGLGVLAAAAVTAVAARRLLLVVTVKGTSMTPTFAPGQRLVVLRTPAARPRTGAVVVFRLPPREGGEVPAPRQPLVVKRLVARGGDPVPDGVLPAVAARPGDLVPEGSLVLLGDDPATSSDSRDWGYLEARRVSGVVLGRLRGRARQPRRQRDADA